MHTSYSLLLCVIQNLRARLGSRKTGLSLNVPRRYFCYSSLLFLSLLSVFMLWFTYYVTDII